MPKRGESTYTYHVSYHWRAGPTSGFGGKVYDLPARIEHLRQIQMLEQEIADSITIQDSKSGAVIVGEAVEKQVCVLNFTLMRVA